MIRRAAPALGAVLALAALAAAIARSDGFAGWRAARLAREGARDVEAGIEARDRVRTERGLVALAGAHAAAPLSHRHRVRLEEAFRSAVAAFDLRFPEYAIARVPEARAVTAAVRIDLRRADRGSRDRLRAAARDPVALGWVANRARDLARDDRCWAAAPLLEAVAAEPRELGVLDLLRIRCLSHVGQTARAAGLAADLASRLPASPWPPFLLAEARLEGGELGEADRLSAGLTRARPDFYFGWHLRGRVLAERGLAADAAAAFEQALALRPGSPWVAGWIAELRRAAAAGEPTSDPQREVR